ncbi:MAG: cytochrome b/b6 domain-containing protein [Anaerolineales bacterium]|nr:cytochrome b/b6 domain-containing protein [Anaerolineales bacterium]
MSTIPRSATPEPTRLVRTFQRFTLGQRWEHAVLILSALVLALTGLPQKYRAHEISQQILSTPERVQLFQQIHHLAALLLILEVLYHLGNAIALLFQRRLSGDIFPSLSDFRDAWLMLKYLLFLNKEKPAFGKYNFEQKVTYWFLFFGVGIMIATGLVLWFPITATRFLPGGVIPAAKLAHSTEAIAAVVFVLIWHFYHVHVERLNLSIFTGWLTEKDMRNFHALELQMLVPGTPLAENHPQESEPGGAA